MQSIKFVTLAVPLLSGCQLLDHLSQSTMRPAGALSSPAEDPLSLPSAASDESVQLRTAPGLSAASQLEREEVRAETRFGDADFQREQAKALAGDAQAAMHIARMYAEGSNGVPRDERAMVQWLKHASLLDHAGASYQLYLYYVARGLDRDAVRYERRALRQGYTLPVRLDNRRG